jgi:hypothetical protein
VDVYDHEPFTLSGRCTETGLRFNAHRQELDAGFFLGDKKMLVGRTSPAFSAHPQ